MVRPIDSFSCNFDDDFDIHDVIKKLKQYNIYENIKKLRIKDCNLTNKILEKL